MRRRVGYAEGGWVDDPQAIAAGAPYGYQSPEGGLAAKPNVSSAPVEVQRADGTVGRVRADGTSLDPPAQPQRRQGGGGGGGGRQQPQQQPQQQAQPRERMTWNKPFYYMGNDISGDPERYGVPPGTPHPLDQRRAQGGGGGGEQQQQQERPARPPRRRRRRGRNEGGYVTGYDEGGEVEEESESGGRRQSKMGKITVKIPYGSSFDNPSSYSLQGTSGARGVGGFTLGAGPGPTGNLHNTRDSITGDRADALIAAQTKNLYDPAANMNAYSEENTKFNKGGYVGRTGYDDGGYVDDEEGDYTLDPPALPPQEAPAAPELEAPPDMLPPPSDDTGSSDTGSSDVVNEPYPTDTVDPMQASTGYADAGGDAGAAFPDDTGYGPQPTEKSFLNQAYDKLTSMFDMSAQAAELPGGQATRPSDMEGAGAGVTPGADFMSKPQPGWGDILSEGGRRVGEALRGWAQPPVPPSTPPTPDPTASAGESLETIKKGLADMLRGEGASAPAQYEQAINSGDVSKIDVLGQQIWNGFEANGQTNEAAQFLQRLRGPYDGLRNGAQIALDAGDIPGSLKATARALDLFPDNMKNEIAMDPQGNVVITRTDMRGGELPQTYKLTTDQYAQYIKGNDSLFDFAAIKQTDAVLADLASGRSQNGPIEEALTGGAAKQTATGPLDTRADVEDYNQPLPNVGYASPDAAAAAARTAADTRPPDVPEFIEQVQPDGSTELVPNPDQRPTLMGRTGLEAMTGGAAAAAGAVPKMPAPPPFEGPQQSGVYGDKFPQPESGRFYTYQGQDPNRGGDTPDAAGNIRAFAGKSGTVTSIGDTTPVERFISGHTGELGKRINDQIQQIGVEGAVKKYLAATYPDRPLERITAQEVQDAYSAMRLRPMYGQREVSPTDPFAGGARAAGDITKAQRPPNTSLEPGTVRDIQYAPRDTRPLAQRPDTPAIYNVPARGTGGLEASQMTERDKTVRPDGSFLLANNEPVPRGYTRMRAEDQNRGWYAVPEGVAPGTQKQTVYTADGRPIQKDVPPYWDPNQIRYDRSGWSSGEAVYPNAPGTRFDAGGRPIPGTSTYTDVGAGGSNVPMRGTPSARESYQGVAPLPPEPTGGRVPLATAPNVAEVPRPGSPISQILPSTGLAGARAPALLAEQKLLQEQQGRVDLEKQRATTRETPEQRYIREMAKIDKTQGELNTRAQQRSIDHRYRTDMMHDDRLQAIVSREYNAAQQQLFSTMRANLNASGRLSPEDTATYEKLRADVARHNIVLPPPPSAPDAPPPGTGAGSVVRQPQERTGLAQSQQRSPLFQQQPQQQPQRPQPQAQSGRVDLNTYKGATPPPMPLQPNMEWAQSRITGLWRQVPIQ